MLADIFSKSKRSEIMSKISGKETKPEILVRKYLFSQGFRFLKNDKRYPGTPDIVLPKYNTMIFVHGCFWHGHDCNAASLPETRREFWENKIAGNIDRDQRNKSVLVDMGWNVNTVWQCEIKNKTVRKERLERLVNQIKRNA